MPRPGAGVLLDLRRSQWLRVLGVTGYVVLAAAGVCALVAGGADPAAVAVLAAAAVVLLVVALAATLARTSAAARRLAADTRLIVDANPAHRVDPADVGELYHVAAVVNRLAERRLAAEREVRVRVDAARRDMETERNRLAALMGQLSIAVVVCNVEGSILLYNTAARAVLGDAAELGLGRSVFGFVDRAVIAHVYDRLATGEEPVQTVTTLYGERLLRVRVALVEDAGAGRAPGFVLVLDDLTRQLRAAEHRERLLRRLTQHTRASLGSIRAAAESVLEFPDLSAAERRRFLEIVRQEADVLGRRLDDWVTDSTEQGEDLLPADIAAAHLLAVLARELDRAGVQVDAVVAPDDVWLRADSHGLVRAVVHLISRLRDSCDVRAVSLAVTAEGRHLQLDARWQGPVPAVATFGSWLDEHADGATTTTVRQVAEQHGAEIWCGAGVAGTGYLRLLLPRSSGGRSDGARPASVQPTSRPEFYDFDLFTPRPQSPRWGERHLDELSFTVLDTETTGLDPGGGDRVVAVGAVRVVNGRLLRHETFERLVQPQRSVPAAASAIHGITTAMLEGAPTLGEVLPDLGRFAEGTVLVGHNLGFDLQFLQSEEEAARPLLLQPALDTLLLDAALHPEFDDHTLEAIAARLGVSVVGRHTALGDALVTAEILVEMLPVLRRRGITTLDDAVSASRETYHARVDQRLYGR